MPVNSFENYILTWKPDKSRLHSPLYISLAHLMEEDIRCGTLTKDTKLPPQRELADYLDISLNTVTRAYNLCEKQGLIYAVTGKGTFVNNAIGTKKTIVEKEDTESVINICSTVSPVTNMKQVKDIIKRIMDKENIDNHFSYPHPFGTQDHIHAAKKWLRLFGINASDNILFTNGSQNSLTLILTSLFQSGDKIIVDQYTYPNFIGLANMLHIMLLPVPSDENGMDSMGLAKILNTNNVKGIYLSPSCTNPQAICMPVERRREISQLIDDHNLILIEDDCYAFISQNKLPPISTMVKNNYLYITEFNKAVSPAVSSGIVYYSDDLKNRMEQANYNCNLVVDWFSAETASQAIEQQIYEKTIDDHIAKIQRRNQIYGKYFDITNINSYYQWLELPPGISSIVFESVAMKAGVKVYGSERFLTGDSGGRYFLRISPTAPQTETQLEKALSVIKRIIDDIQSKAADINYTV